MAEPELAVVYSPREWANRVVRHITDHGGGRVRLRVVDRRRVHHERIVLGPGPGGKVIGLHGHTHSPLDRLESF